MNEHLKKYLKEYLKLNKPEFAVLLTGEWGSGKTYFIDKFIKENRTKDNMEFIKISFFGISNKDELQHEIIIKLLETHTNSGWLNGNIGTKIINSFGKKLGLSIYDIPIGEILKKMDRKIVFIFDDLERANILLNEILGHINGYVEILKLNVIILANELEIKDKKYQKFKEKVIGKTFVVQHDFNTILNSFIDENTDKSKTYLNEHKNTIKNIYIKANYRNLRHIKQILLDFEYFAKIINKKYLDNKEFISILINNFFALSIELKSGSLEEDELYKHDNLNYLFDESKEQSNVSKIYEKYNIVVNSIFSGEIWTIVLLKSFSSSEEINKIISSLSFFIEEEKNKQASWVKLWYYRELENDDFEKTLKDVLAKFHESKYEVPEHFLHVIALLIFFHKKELSALTFEQIKKQVTISIEEYKKTSTWKEKLFDDMMDYNSTGLGYMDEDSDEFRKIYKLIMNENENIYFQNEKVVEKNKLKELLEAIEKNDVEAMRELLLNEYKEKPILKNLATEDFFLILKNIGNKNITNLSKILIARYPDNHYMEGQKVYCYYLKDELEFWENIDSKLIEYVDKNRNKNLSFLLLKSFHEYAVKKNVKKLKNCN